MRYAYVDMTLKQNIQDNIQAHLSGTRFGMNPVPRHIHNNIDSPFVFLPIVTFIGRINSDGSSLLLPSGWSSTRNSMGSYTVTHNLGSSSYVVTGNADSTKLVLIVTDISKNSFTVNLFETIFLGLVNSAFMFSLTNPFNTTPVLPKYVGA